LGGRQRMLAAFDQAKTQSKGHKVEVHHGNVAEEQFREWLRRFLPKKFGVTAGFVVSPAEAAHSRLSHYDVIIYNQLEAPILWIEDGKTESMGIPVQYVLAIFEVKASMDRKTIKDAIQHLDLLAPFAQGKDDPHTTLYRLHLPERFFCGMIFFELKGANSSHFKALEHITKSRIFPILSGLVLRSDERDPVESAQIQIATSETPTTRHQGDDKGRIGLAANFILTESTEVTPQKHALVITTWSHAAFTSYAAHILRLLQGEEVYLPMRGAI
jgi:hypothetical protein